MSRIISYFPESDLRSSHAGLTKIAIKARRDPRKMADGNFIVFVNRAKTACKILGPNNVLIHVRGGDENQRLNFAALNLLPKYFGGGSFNYRGALRETLEKHLSVRYHNLSASADRLLEVQH